MKKLYHHLKDVCSGVGGRDIRAVLGKSLLYQWLNVRFQNKAVLKPVRARTVQIRDELDLVSMESMPAKWNGKVFKYVLSPTDVFSRYHWLYSTGKKVAQLQRRYQQFTKSMGLLVSFRRPGASIRRCCQ